MHDRHHDGVQIEALLGQNIFVPLRPRLVRNTPQYAMAHQLLEPIGENVTGYLESGLEILKVSDSEKTVPQDEQAPPVPDHR
jgi:hypothetical protein